MEVPYVTSEPETESADVATFRQRAREWLAAEATRPDVEQATGPGSRLAHVTVSQRFQARLHDAGYAGITWPEEYGGRALSAAHERAFLEEAAEYELPTGLFSIGMGMCGPALLTFGTEEQKRDYLRPMLRGEKVWCQLFSEPGAGSDVASLQTSAVRDGADWVLNGQKVWTTGAHVSDFGIVIARTDPAKPKHAGITMFVLDMNSPGVTIRPLRQMTGGDDFNEVFFDDVRVPSANVVGEIDAGWQAATVMLMNERVSIGAGRRSERTSTAYSSLCALARERGLDRDPVVRQRLADLFVRQRTLELLSVRIRNRVRAGVDPGPFASIAKLTNAAMAKTAAALAVDIAGLDAVAWDPSEPGGGDWATAVLSAPATAIAGGTDEIQRNIIGDRVLGLPREPRADRDVPFRDLKVGTQRPS
jgi:alkylation response protein AidB-like acyl-CoA dehydrogenase